MSVSSTISLVGEVSRDCLAREHCRLSHTQTNLRRYISSLNAIRNSIHRQYMDSKTLFVLERYRQLRHVIRDALTSYQDILVTKESELRILDRGDFDLLESVDCNLEDSPKFDRNKIESLSFLDDDEQSIRRAQILEQLNKHNDKSNNLLKKEIRQLQLSVTELQEIFKAECAIFQHLATQYNSCRKYRIIQRYVALKCITKIASIANL